MDLKTLHERLNNLWDTKSVLEKNGPNSPLGGKWLAEVRAHLQIASPSLAVEFAHYMTYVGLPLSSQTLGPIWTNMQGILRTSIAMIETKLPSNQGKIYAPGDAIDVYRDLSQIVLTARIDVFIADLYADQEIFDLYLEKIATGVKIRLLTKLPSSALKTLSTKFSTQLGPLFEARSTNAIHDRVIIIDGQDCWVIGQSIKDAGMKKPTYLLPVTAVSDMAKLYEDAWKSAIPY
jgi:hypothetical protein